MERLTLSRQLNCLISTWQHFRKDCPVKPDNDPTCHSRGVFGLTTACVIPGLATARVIPGLATARVIPGLAPGIFFLTVKFNKLYKILFCKRLRVEEALCLITFNRTQKVSLCLSFNTFKDSLFFKVFTQFN